jgi:hypothetical protein
VVEFVEIEDGVIERKKSWVALLLYFIRSFLVSYGGVSQ